MTIKSKIEPRYSADFYLVQRLREAPYKRHQEVFPGAKVKSNPFGYGRMGDYELDYMGAAEFEFGAIPEANNRLAKAGKGLTLGEYTYGGHTLDFLWIKTEGEPFEAFADWAEGKRTSEYGTHEDRPFFGKEMPYELRERLDGKQPFDKERGWHAALWWALRANVIWAFQEDGPMGRWIESMGSAPTEFLR
jgi:hypothetical protein